MATMIQPLLPGSSGSTGPAVGISEDGGGRAEICSADSSVLGIWVASVVGTLVASVVGASVASVVGISVASVVGTSVVGGAGSEVAGGSVGGSSFGMDFSSK